MAINTTPKEKAAGGFHTTTATAINNSNFRTAERNDKASCTLQAAFALKGHAPHRTHPTDGPSTYWVERWGLVRYLPRIDKARQFLEQVGGGL